MDYLFIFFLVTSYLSHLVEFEAILLEFMYCIVLKIWQEFHKMTTSESKIRKMTMLFLKLNDASLCFKMIRNGSLYFMKSFYK